MTGPHPGKTAAQRRVLDEIGCGNNSPAMAKATEKALLEAGLIERLSDRIFGAGHLSVHVKQYQMPIAVHMAWCLSVEDEEAAGIDDLGGFRET